MKSLNHILLGIIILPFILTSNLYAQKLKSGPQDLVFFSPVDETNQPYSIYIPKNYDENKKYPLVVFLHGIMSNNRLGLRRVFGVGNTQGPDFGTPGFVPPQTDLEATRYFPEFRDVDYFVVAPYARGTAGYQGIPEQDIYQMLEDIKSRFNIDEDRLYLTGLSAGGAGTLWLGLTRPDLWAAIAPLCPAVPESVSELAGNALNIPVHLFVGDRDPLYPTAQQCKVFFEANNVHTEYTVYPGIGHNCWEYAYKDGFIFDWFDQFKRDPLPAHVKYSTRQFKYNKAYWVTMDNFTPGSWATIDAGFTGSNAMEVTTTGLEAFTLNLKGHSMFNANTRLNIIIDGKSFTIKTPDAVSFSKDKGVWTNMKFTPGLFSKKQGAEGPILEAVYGNHIYVYGTADNPDPDELKARVAEATLAADWAADRPVVGRIMIFPRVLADKEVRQSDIETSNLVLFGTAESNSLIGKYAERLPLHLKANAVKEYGLVYIFPLNNHYVLVNSGLPWWTPEAPKENQQVSRGFSMTLSKAASVLPAFKDFILFKNTRDNVISEGFFDNNWEISSQERSKLNSSGMVEVK